MSRLIVNYISRAWARVTRRRVSYGDYCGAKVVSGLKLKPIWHTKPLNLTFIQAVLKLEMFGMWISSANMDK